MNAWFCKNTLYKSLMSKTHLVLAYEFFPHIKNACAYTTSIFNTIMCADLCHAIFHETFIPWLQFNFENVAIA